ncbi:MAG: hypothetical protein LC808_32965 [Actinobacteria bacterium]|nr:hypothetical protein [Actinomycetota bacterium]
MRIQREDPQGWAEYLGELTGWEAGAAPTDPLPSRSGRSTTPLEVALDHAIDGIQALSR